MFDWFDLPRPLMLAALMCAHYLVLTFNVRAVARGHMAVTAITDLVIAVLGFTLIRQVGEATGAADQAGYAVGGMLGSMLALGLSRRGRRARRRQARQRDHEAGDADQRVDGAAERALLTAEWGGGRALPAQARRRSEPPIFTSLL